MTRRLVCLVSLLTSVSHVAHAFDPSFIDLIYQETFDGEVSYPLTPEVDVLSMGGILSSTAVLTGSVARMGAPDELGLFALASTHSGQTMTRGAFENVQNADDLLANPSAMFQAGFLQWYETAPGEYLRYGGGVLLQADPAGSGFVAALSMLESRFTFSGGIEFLQQRVEILPPDAATAIEAGSPFTIDLFVDHEDGEFGASVRSDAFAELHLAPLIPSHGGGALPLSSAYALAQCVGCTVEDVEIDLALFEIYRAFEASFEWTFTVTTTDDASDANQGDGVCATPAGECSLRAAIQEANLRPGTDLIVVPAGHYVLSVAVPGTEDFAREGDLDIRDDLIIRGAGAESTIIDANGIDRVIDLPELFPARADIANLTLRGGSTVEAGGGIQNAGTLRISDCIIEDNLAAEGAGIMNRAELLIERCTIEGNAAWVGGAGGIASGSSDPAFSFMEQSTLKVRKSSIVDNSGTGIEVSLGLGAVIENSTIAWNDCCVQLRNLSQDLTLDHVTLVGEGLTLESDQFGGSHELNINNSAIEGQPACSITSVIQTNSGNNASNDGSCNFLASGDVTSTPLQLSGLLVGGGNQYIGPLPGSPLIDAADGSTCLLRDQLDTVRPVDGDGSGGAECDIGAIEVFVPEPRRMLLAGAALLSWLARRRGRSLRA